MNRIGTCWLLLLLTGALALALRHIDVPGLQYDELLFVNAARGGERSDLFVDARIGGEPVLLMKYMGALKAWIYRPILAAFPFGAMAVRAPAVALGLAGAALLIAGLGRLLGGRAVLLAAPVVLLDPTLLMQSRLDWGPNALMYLLRGMMFFSLCSWVGTRRSRWLLVGLLAACAGVYDKLNFLWFASACLGALLLCFGGVLAAAARRERIRYGLLGFLALAAGLVAAWRAVHVAAWLPTGHSPGTLAHAGDVARLLALTLCGAGARDFVCGTGLQGCRPLLAAWALLLLLGAVAAMRGGAWRSRPSLFVLGTLLGTVAWIFLTPAAIGVHHAAMVAGLPQAAFVAFCCAGTAGTAGRSPIVELAAPGLCALLLTTLFVASVLHTERLFREPTNPNWDPANQEAAAFAGRSGRDVVVADWGLSTLLAGYCRDPGAVLDAWQVLGTRGGAEFFVRTLDAGRRYEVLVRRRDVEFFKGGGKALIAALQAAGWTVDSRTMFAAWNGEDLVDVYGVRRP